MPLYVADYIKDTGHLSAAEHGAYLLLIMHYWSTGGLPIEDKRLASIARLSLQEWHESRDTIAAFFTDGWRSAKIDAQLARSEESRKRLYSIFVPNSAKRPNAETWHSTRVRIFQRDNFTCTYCSQRGGRLECDHISPIGRGGGNEDENLTTACKSCNQSKGVKTLEEWLSQ